MSSTILAFTFALARAVDPEHDHSTMVEAIAKVAIASPPLFADDANKEKTLSLLVSVAWREGSLRESVEGDCSESKPGEPCKGRPSSFCSFQIHRSSGGSAALNADPELCVRTGMALLRTSMKVCSAHPIAHYAAGPSGCSNVRAQRISRDRLALAGRLRASARETIAKDEAAAAKGSST